MRGRSVQRDYGGDSILSLGSISIYRGEKVAAPELAFSALSYVDAGKHATAYASYTRGLEDSFNAPTSAVIRGKPVPVGPDYTLTLATDI